MPNDAEKWGRVCRSQAALSTDHEVRDVLLALAAEYEATAVSEGPDPDDPALQSAVARRLMAAAVKLKDGVDL